MQPHSLLWEGGGVAPFFKRGRGCGYVSLWLCWAWVTYSQTFHCPVFGYLATLTASVCTYDTAFVYLHAVILKLIFFVQANTCTWDCISCLPHFTYHLCLHQTCRLYCPFVSPISLPSPPDPSVACQDADSWSLRWGEGTFRTAWSIENSAFSANSYQSHAQQLYTLVCYAIYSTLVGFNVTASIVEPRDK